MDERSAARTRSVRDIARRAGHNSATKKEIRYGVSRNRAMTDLAMLLTGLFLVTLLSVARAGSRGELVETIESLQARAMLTTGPVPLVTLTLSAARRQNPSVSEATWSEIREEILSAMTKPLLVSGSQFDTAFHLAVHLLSDDDLKGVLAAMSNPAYLKYQAAIVSPSVIQGFVNVQRQFASALLPEVNKVFAKHEIPAMR
jgi:hypothetical protein